MVQKSQKFAALSLGVWETKKHEILPMPRFRFACAISVNVLRKQRSWSRGLPIVRVMLCDLKRILLKFKMKFFCSLNPTLTFSGSWVCGWHRRAKPFSLSPSDFRELERRLLSILPPDHEAVGGQRWAPKRFVLHFWPAMLSQRTNDEFLNFWLWK